MDNNYDVCFYLDNEKIEEEYRAKFNASSKTEALKKAILEFNPTNKGLYTVMLWSSPD